MDFVIVANAWAASSDNPTSKHHVAMALVRKGHRVLWMEGAGMRRMKIGLQSDRSRAASKVRAAMKGARVEYFDGGACSVHVVTPLPVPLPSLPIARRLNGLLYRVLAERWCARLGFIDPVLINYVPVLSACMRGWRGCRVYHCVDRWDAFAMYDAAAMADGDTACCRLADLVLASSRDLYERCAAHASNVHLVAHGVEHAHFALALASPSRPPDMPSGPIIGTFGLISEWIDQPLVVRLAREIPGASVVWLGKADVSTDAMAETPGIRILGPRPYADLPAYAAHFDVGIIPFLVNDLTRAVNPIKLREMLSAGCPVVSTALPEVEAYAAGPGVTVASSPDAFVAAVRDRITGGTPRSEREAISSSMRGETWSAKVDLVLEAIRSCGSRGRDVIPGQQAR